MSVINVSAAASAKARAMYATMLGTDDYRTLARCANVSEFASCLESGVRYSRVFKSGYAKDFHREQIENMLDSSLYIDYLKLCKYLKGGDSYIGDYIKRKREIRIIIKSVMHVYVSGADKLYYNILQTEFDRASKLDIRRMSSAKSYLDIVASSFKTEYYSVLNGFAPAEGENFNITELDSALHDLVYRLTLSEIEKYTFGRERADTLSMFSAYVDCLNFVTLRRIKTYGSYDNERLRRLMISGGSFSEKKLSELIATRDTSELYAGIASSRFAKSVIGIEEDDSLPMKVFSRLSLHALRFSPYPDITVLSYMFLCEVEIANIVTALEGIRYSLPEDEIMKMMIIP